MPDNPDQLLSGLKTRWAKRMYWMEHNLKIIDRKGKLVRYVRNVAQRGLYGAMWEQIRRGLPVRIIVLKARQEGVTTGSQALAYECTYEDPNFHAMLAAHDSDSTNTIFRMTKRFEAYLPQPKKRPQFSSRREIAYPVPHDSTIEVATAGKENLGRGYTLTYFHGSEVAFWTSAEASLLSVLQAIPNESNTFIILESTANGVGGAFYDRWQAAVKARMEKPDDLSGFTPLFLSWLDFPEYRLVPDRQYDFGMLDSEELSLQQSGADMEQLYWRRIILAEKCGGDADMFKQEYPSTPEEAFLLSGRRAIPPAITTYHRRLVKPGRKARLVTKPAWGRLMDIPAKQRPTITVEAKFDESLRPPYWLIWHEPREMHDYTVGGDTITGQVTDQADEKSDSDFHAAFVLDRQDWCQSAAFVDTGLPSQRMDVDLFGEQMLLAALYYNQGWASPEVNKGMAALMVLKRWPYFRTYNRQGCDDKIHPEQARALGWRTDMASRPFMIDRWIAENRPGEGVPLEVYYDRLVDQEEQFIYDKMGKRVHRPGAHDDDLFGAMIALELHFRCPRTQVKAQVRRENPQFTDGRLYAGGFDKGIPGAGR